jgi:hypothetical protein
MALGRWERGVEDKPRVLMMRSKRDLPDRPPHPRALASSFMECGPGSGSGSGSGNGSGGPVSGGNAYRVFLAHGCAVSCCVVSCSPPPFQLPPPPLPPPLWPLSAHPSQPSTYDAAMNNCYWETRPVRVITRLLRIGGTMGA